MGIALQKLAEEDPSFQVKTDTETGQTIISGMGELHLDIIVDRMLREFKVEANVGKPQVAYRETIRGTADQDSKFIRQSGGKGQYGHVKVRIHRLKKMQDLYLKTKLSAVQFQENILNRPEKVWKKLLKVALWQVSQ